MTRPDGAPRAGGSDGTLCATRRGVLGLLGTAALAGCSGPLLGGDDEPILDTDALRALTATDARAVPETLPVDIDPGHVDDVRERAESLLAAAPLPFDEEEIPNGAVRAELMQSADRAETALAEADDADSPFEALVHIRGARAAARGVAAGWGFIDDGLRREDLLTEADAHADELAEFRETFSLVGDDPVDSVIVYATIERYATRAEVFPHGRPERGENPETPLTVADLAEDLERARAALDDARHFAARHEASLSEGRTLRDVFEKAGDALVSTLETRRKSLPDENLARPSTYADGLEEARSVAGVALGDLGWRVNEAAADARDAPGPASTVCESYDRLARFDAFESVLSAVRDGERYAVADADDVRGLRNDAIDAIRVSLSRGAHADLVRAEIAELADFLGHYDEDLRRQSSEEVRPSWIRRPLAGYVQIAEVARAVPGASQRVVDALETADGD